MQVLTRYLIRTLLPPFGFALFALSCLMSTGFVLFGLIEESARFEYSLGLMLQIVWLRLPEMLGYTLPMAMLMGTLLAVSRLSDDHEVLALRSSGMSLWQMLWPLLAFSLLITGLALGLKEWVAAPATWQARQLLHAAQHDDIKLARHQRHLLMKEMGPEGLRSLIYAANASGQNLEQVVIQRFEQQTLQTVIQARQAHFEGQTWRFYDGHMLQLNHNAPASVHFKTYILPLPDTITTLLNEARGPEEMNQQELAAFIKTLDASGQDTRALKLRWHQKWALPMTAPVFCLWGAGMGLRSLRGAGQGLGITLLLILIYYLLMSIGTALGDRGELPPWLGAWSPVLISSMLGLGLISWRNQH
ncbi:MAG: LptF/LptG family permease [Candidatus Sericytochromatia bacterium]|nr:LptF/LptG family permease [Candidatus Sericytochromatia bacterium]